MDESKGLLPRRRLPRLSEVLKSQRPSIFPYTNLHTRGSIKRLVLNFSFKEINFSKKKALPFFLAVELLTRQKCIATLSSRNLAS